MPPLMDKISFRRISYGRHCLLKNKHLKMRQKLKRQRKELKRERKRMLMVKLETLELHRALTSLEHTAHFVDARADVVCECCFEAIKINEYGDSLHEKCKECQRLLCSNCCFASEKPPLWYCLTCIITRKLLRIWRPNTEGWCDRVLQERLREGVNILMRSINDLRRAEAQPAVDTPTTPVLHSLARDQSGRDRRMTSAAQHSSMTCSSYEFRRP